MLVGCAKHDTFDTGCLWCITATEAVRKVLWRRRWRDMKEIVSKLLR
jgi:hypothetical protein